MRPVQRKAVGSGLSSPPPTDFCIPSVAAGNAVKQPNNPYHAISQPPSRRPTTSAAPQREWRGGAAVNAAATSPGLGEGDTSTASHSNNPFEREWGHEAKAKGYPQGSPVGYDEGHPKGYPVGYPEGYPKGSDEGHERYDYPASVISQSDSIASEVTPWQSSTSMVYQDADSVPQMPSLPSLPVVSPLVPVPRRENGARSPYRPTSPFVDAAETPHVQEDYWDRGHPQGQVQPEQGYQQDRELQVENDYEPEHDYEHQYEPEDAQAHVHDFEYEPEHEHVHELDNHSHLHGHPQGHPHTHLHMQTESPGLYNGVSHEPPTPETPSSYQPSIAPDEAALGIGTGSDYVRRRRRGAGITSSSTTPTTLPIGIKAVPATHQMSAPPAFVRKAMDIRYAHLPQRMLASEILDDEDEEEVPASPSIGGGHRSHESQAQPFSHHRHSHSLTTVRSSLRRTSSSESVVEDTGKIKLFVANPDD